ncbi:MAG: peptidoglycan-binding protein [Bdellovibrio sp.]
MNYKAWLVKAAVCGLCMTMLVPSFANATEYGPNTISAFLNKEGRETVYKPKWANFVLHTALHRKFYGQRSNMPVWIDASGYPNQMATALRETLLSADRHGLHPQDYWNETLESAFIGSQEDPRLGITFEFVATEAVLRYGQHLFQGRVDPRTVDEDIKYEGNTFADKEITIVAAAVNKAPSEFTSALEILSPQLPRYKDFMKVLEYFRDAKGKGNWAVIKSPGMIMQKGVRTEAIAQIRQRFNELGYKISVGSDSFDGEFDGVLRKFQKDNGLAIDGTIGINRSAALQTLNKNIDERISQIEVTMEKLRWLPRTFETRFIFVNLATSEFRLLEGNKLLMSLEP